MLRLEGFSFGAFIEAGGMAGIERTAAERAIADEREFWSRILEAWAAEPGDDPSVRIYLDDQIRRLRRLLKLPPVPSPQKTERRREQTRARVRRHRDRERLKRAW